MPKALLLSHSQNGGKGGLKNEKICIGIDNSANNSSVIGE